MTLIRPTRKIQIGSTTIGGDSPILIQSMCSTKTTNREATLELIRVLSDAGAGLIRVAVDTEQDVEALLEIRRQTKANLSVDLQENFRLAEKVAPYVDKIRYNPGHLFHREPELSWQEKVAWLVKIARQNDCALRIGVNCGSLDPKVKEGFSGHDLDPLLQNALEHTEWIEELGFERFCVSIKDSDPRTVLLVNRRFAQLHPEVPLHLGVTEAGMPPLGVLKSRAALEPLLSEGIGDTLRVSLTVATPRKIEEVEAGLQILDNVRKGTIVTPESVALPRLNIISCPSCSRVQNTAFIELAERIREETAFAKDHPITIAVMGCRVNGPGETDQADIGLWCGADRVHLKEGSESRGSWSFEEILPKTLELLHSLIEKKPQ